MHIQVNFGDVDSSSMLTECIDTAVRRELGHLTERITRVEVHLHDDNAHKSGPVDKRCTMEARLANQPPLAVEQRGEDFYLVIEQAAKKLGRAIRHKTDRLNQH